MLTVNELFSGIGSQRAALERLGIEHKVVGIAEIDKFAIKSYEAIWGETKNYGDISKVNKLDYADFWTYSFPCQDISVAGKQAGINKHTRSGLLYEVERLLEKSRECGELPKYLMLENVKNLVGKKFKPQFEEWIQRLDELGYNTYWQVLNAKNYGIPQNRERVFGISIRKDIDTGYEFTEPFDNGKRLKDILEVEVDKKYYINNEKANKLIQKLSDTNQLTDVINPCDGTINEPKVKDISNCIKARYDAGVSNQKSDGTMVVEKNELDVAFSLRGCGMPWDKRYEAICRVYNPIGISPTVTAGGGGGIEPKVLIPQATKQGYIECNVPGVADLSFPDSKTRRGRVQENGEIVPTLMAGQQDICYMEPVIAASRGRNPNNPSDRTVGSPTEQRLEINKNGTSNTITTVQKDNYVLEGVDVHPFSKKLEFRGYKQKEVSPCLLATDYKAPKTIIESQTNSSHAQKDNLVVEQVRALAKTARPNTEIGVTLKPNGDIRPHRMDIKKSGIQELNINHEDNPSHTVTSAHMPKVYGDITDFRIRKLTPKECWRLMGFTDEQFQKAQDAGVSNSQLYKQAGNSIVVDVLYYIFRNLFIEKPEHRVCVDNTEQLKGQMNLLDYLQGGSHGKKK